MIFNFTILLSGIYICRYLYISLSVSVGSLRHQMTDRVVRYRLDGTDKSVVVSSWLPVTAMTINDKGEAHRLNNNHAYNFSCMTLILVSFFYSYSYFLATIWSYYLWLKNCKYETYKIWMDWIARPISLVNIFIVKSMRHVFFGFSANEINVGKYSLFSSLWPKR